MLRQFLETESSTWTYLIYCQVTKEALLIDPVLETVERDLQQISELGLQLKYVLNTHCHADHISSSGVIKERSVGEVTSIIAKESKAKADIHIVDGDIITYGTHTLKAIATPGHTEGCISYYSQDLGCVFTGDTLLVRGCGRTDFQGGSSADLYDSVHQKLFTLPGTLQEINPDETIVYPGHDYKGNTCSSIKEEKKHNPRLTKSKSEFIDFMANLGLKYPAKIDVAVPANLNCGLVAL
jgi:sulfur dioxygenase